MYEDVVYAGMVQIQEMEQFDIQENPSVTCKIKMKIDKFSFEVKRYITKPFRPISWCTAKFSASLDVYEASVLEVSLTKISMDVKPLQVTHKTSMALSSIYLEGCLKQTSQKTIFTYTDVDNRCVCFCGSPNFRTPDDHLSIPDHVEVDFEFKMKGFVQKGDVVIRMREPNVRNSVLAEAIVRSFLYQEHVDTLLCVGTENIGAHKVVLCARSSVFAKVFQNEAAAAGTERVITLHKISFSTLKSLLTFMYTGCVNVLDFGTLSDLYHAAHMYKMPDLLKQCAVTLKYFLSPDMICRLLRFAAQYNDPVLRTGVAEYLRNHSSEVGNRDDWKELSSSRPDLLDEIMSLCL